MDEGRRNQNQVESRVIITHHLTNIYQCFVSRFPLRNVYKITRFLNRETTTLTSRCREDWLERLGMFQFVVWKQRTASFPSGILPQITVHINEPPTQIKYFWMNYLLTVWMKGFNLFASILLPASLHHACFLLPSFLSLPPLFHISPLPAPLQPSVSLRKSSFFFPRYEARGPRRRSASTGGHPGLPAPLALSSTAVSGA